MARIVFLGTASSIPSKRRDNTSFLFTHSKETFLIDCPGAIVHKLLKVGFDFKKLNNIVITHHHPDHVYGIASLVHSRFCLNDKINIYSNSYTLRLIRKLMNLFNLNRKQFPKIKYLNVFSKNHFYARRYLKLKAIRNSHCKDSFGVLFRFNKKSVLYTSDTAFYPKMLSSIKNIDCLIHDCTASSSYFRKYPALYKMHTNAKQLAQAASNNPKTKIIPVHFLLVRGSEQERIRKELKRVKNISFVKDFDTIRL